MQQLHAATPWQQIHRIGPMQPNTAVVIEALLRQLPKEGARHDPSRLQLPVRRMLEANLPKKGLKPFLLRHCDKFEVHPG